MRRTIVVGGGIAGLSVAWQLAERGGRRVSVLEREVFVGTHSSARNAQIWLPVDDDRTTGPLARRTVALMNTLLEEDAWLRRGEAIVLAPDEAHARALERGAARGGLRARAPSRGELERCSPLLRPPAEPARMVEGAGILEPSAMIGALTRACRQGGVELETGRGVRGLGVERDRVRGVELDDGTQRPADEVVIAGGAWARALGRSAGVDVPLVPLRRHLVVLDAEPQRAGTTVWRFGDEQVYWRPESGGVLTSPCDETPFEPCLPPTDPAALEGLFTRLAPLAPELLDAPVRTAWACLRTYAPDRELVLGADPRVQGLAWMAGFGGRGMTVAVGAGALCAEAMDGRVDPLLAGMRPERPWPASPWLASTRPVELGPPGA